MKIKTAQSIADSDMPINEAAEALAKLWVETKDKLRHMIGLSESEKQYVVNFRASRAACGDVIAARRTGRQL